jgi:L-fucose isomerase-like protein
MDRFRRVYQAVDAKAVEDESQQWIEKAEKVIEPSKEDILKASRTYLTMKNIISEEGARAITINCLGGFALDELGYPCLGFSKLNDQGIIAACEADMDSTLTMLMFGYAFGVPGFISDPVFDTATDTVIHAHCLSATKMDGPAGPRCPYFIRSHNERRVGACLQVKHRIGQPITCAKLVNLDTMLISTGKIVGNPDLDRACRTKMATRVANARKMLDNWGGGVVEGGMVEHLHRVIFYGDRLQNIKHLCVLMGRNVIEEV